MPRQPSSRSRSTRGPDKRTRSGCLTCRTRKVKCDELFISAACGNCRRINRHCDTGIMVTFRNQQNPSFKRKEEEAMSAFYTYRNTFEEGAVWVGVPMQWIEVDAAKILEQEFEGHHYRQQQQQQHHVPSSRQHVESAPTTYPYLQPQQQGRPSSNQHPDPHKHYLAPPPQPQQLQPDTSWRPAQTPIQQSLHALSDAVTADDNEHEERTLHPYDFSFYADENDDDDEDDLDYVPISPSDLLPLSKNQQEQMQLRRRQEEELEELEGLEGLDHLRQQEQEQLGTVQTNVDVDVETTQAREYAEESLDLFLKNAAAHAAAGYIDPSLAGQEIHGLLVDGEEDMQHLWGGQDVTEEEEGAKGG